MATNKRNVHKASSFSSTLNEQELFALIEKGRVSDSLEDKAKGQEAAYLVASSYFPYAEATVIKEFSDVCTPGTTEDLFQEAKIALLEAANSFDYRKGAIFSTYAYPWIRNSCNNYLKKLRRSLNRPDPGFENGDFASLNQDGEEMEEENEENQTARLQAIQAVLPKLTSKQKDAIGYRYGLFGKPQLKTFAEIGNAMGISDEAARMHYQVGIGKLSALLKKNNDEY